MLEETFGFPDGTFNDFENVDDDEEDSDFEHEECDSVGRRKGESDGADRKDGEFGQGTEGREDEGQSTDKGGFSEVGTVGKPSNEQHTGSRWPKWNLLRWNNRCE